MKKIHSKLISLLMAFLMLFTFAPVAFAEEGAVDPYFKGSGTEGDPFLISSQEDLMNLALFSRDGSPANSSAEFYFTAYYQLTQDIDMTGYDWYPIGPTTTRPFRGDFDGNGKTISNLRNESRTSGASKAFIGVLFGNVYDLALKNVDFQSRPSSSGAGVGGVVGYLLTNGVIDSCYVTGTLTTDSGIQIGGIAGIVAGSNARISNCTFDGTINATESSAGYLGGIIGCIDINGFTLENCYSAGSINRPGTRSSKVGLIAGGSESTQINTAIYINCTTSMEKNAQTNAAGGWAGYDGDPAVETDLDPTVADNALGLLVTASESQKGVFDLIANIPDKNVNLIETSVNFDSALYDVTAASTANGDVQITKIENGKVFLVIGIKGSDAAIGKSAQLVLASITVVPKAGQKPEQALLSLGDIKAWYKGDTVTLDADPQQATSPFEYPTPIPPTPTPTPPPPTRLPNDVNDDGEVDAADLSIVLWYYGYKLGDDGWLEAADVYEDGIINTADITQLVNILYPAS